MEETQVEVLALLDQVRPRPHAVYKCQLSGRFCVTGELEALGQAIFVRVHWCRREAGRFVLSGGRSEFLATYFLVDFKLVMEQWT